MATGDTINAPFPFFIDDFERDIPRSENPEFQITYLRLLCYLWKHGSIRDDDAEIADRTGIKLAKNWHRKVIRLRFYLVSHPTQSGFLTQSRVHADRQKYLANRAASRERMRKHRNDVTRNDTLMSRERSGNTFSFAFAKEEEEKKESKKKKKTASDHEIEFDQFWNVYPRKVSKGAARKAFAIACKKEAPETIVGAIREWAKRMNGTEAKFIPHAATWLNHERWLDQLSDDEESGSPFDGPVTGWPHP